jgi:hypothetical protein
MSCMPRCITSAPMSRALTMRSMQVMRCLHVRLLPSQSTCGTSELLQQLQLGHQTVGLRLMGVIDPAEADAWYCFVDLISDFRDHFCKQLVRSGRLQTDRALWWVNTISRCGKHALPFEDRRCTVLCRITAIWASRRRCRASMPL